MPEFVDVFETLDQAWHQLQEHDPENHLLAYYFSERGILDINALIDLVWDFQTFNNTGQGRMLTLMEKYTQRIKEELPEE